MIFTMVVISYCTIHFQLIIYCIKLAEISVILYSCFTSGPEGDLRIYLEKLAMAENVQNYVEQNPFGQKAITKSDPRWDFYCKILKPQR